MISLSRARLEEIEANLIARINEAEDMSQEEYDAIMNELVVVQTVMYWRWS